MIKSENLTFQYAAYDESESLPLVLNDINIEIVAGQFVAILGHNGSGKSTLARHLNALLSPTQGTLWVNGMDTRNPKNTWLIRQSTGMVFQNPDNQMIATVVEEDVAFGPENLGVPPAEIRKRVDETLAAVGMSEYATHAPNHLSGGQKQRVAIAGVLAMRPSCIVLDEPSAMLDPSGRREVMETITRLNRAEITVILITHFMEEAARADRVIVMDAGKVVMDDTPRNIFRRVDEMQKLGLGVPQVTALAHKLRTHGIPLQDDIISTAEFVTAITAVTGNAAFMQSKPSVRLEASDLPRDFQAPLKVEAESENRVPIIEMRDVSHIYNAHSVFEKIALADINLSISAGEIVAIIGHTGSGKSTLIQHMNALLKPSSGSIFIDGKDISDKSLLKGLRQRVGLVFQYPEHQLFEETIYKDVAFGPTRMGLSPEEINERVIAALKAVGLGKENYKKSPFELSGGQKRRAAIAGVLAMRPDVLVLDEPAAGLDPRGREEIFAQIKKMHESLGITVILVSHSMDDAARLANRVLVMNKGRLLHDGAPADIFAQGETLKKIGLDTPQILRLMMQLHETNPQIPTRIFTVDDAAAALLSLAKAVEV